MRRKTVVLILIICLVGYSTAAAEDAVLTSIIVTNTWDELLVYLSVAGAFRDDMKKAILSGVPTTFSFFIGLYRVRNFWPDKEIADIEVSHTIKYDNLKKEFTVTRSWENNQPILTKSFEKAQQLMADVDGVKVAPLKWLEKGERYQIKAKAELSNITLPFYLHYVLFFLSLWDFETDWYTIDFVF